MPDRLAIIRTRCRPVNAISPFRPTGLFRGNHPEVPTAVQNKKGLPARDFISDRANGHYQRDIWSTETEELMKHLPAHLKEAPKPERKVLVGHKARIKRVSPLTKIAAHWERKETFGPPR